MDFDKMGQKVNFSDEGKFHGVFGTCAKITPLTKVVTAL